MATKKVILKEIVDGVAGDAIHPKTSIDMVEGLEDALAAAGSVSTISVNGGTPIAPDNNKNIDITIPATVTESTVSDWGFTKNTGTITGITMNGASKGTSGVVDLGTVATDISGKEDKSNKVTSFSSPTDTQYPSAKLVSDQLATKQDTISDIATIRSKAGTAIQSVTVGTTTTGAAGTNASVVNSGTATAPVLDFTIPQGEQGVKGDTVIMGNEDSYTLYNVTGDAVDGAMTQQAVTRELTEIMGRNIVEEIVFTSGYIKTNLNVWDEVDLTPQTSSFTRYAIINVEPGEKLLLDVSGDIISRAWAFIDSNNILLSVAPANTVLHDETIVVPNNAAKAIINDNNSALSYVIRNITSPMFIRPEDLVQEKGSSTTSAVSQAAVFTKKIELQFTLTKYIDTSVSVGSVVDLTLKNTIGTTSCCIYPCKDVSKFVINAVGGNASRAWAFIDSDNRLISHSNANVTVVDYIPLIPENASKIIINNDDNSKTSYAIILGDNTIDAQITNEIGENKDLLMSQYGINNAIKDATTIKEVVDLSKQQKVRYNITTDNIWRMAQDNNLYGVIIKVTPKSVLHIESNDSQSSYFSILRTAVPQDYAYADFASGETGRRVLASSQTADITLPSDAYYLYVYCQGSTLIDYRPSNVTLYSYIKDIVSAGDRQSSSSDMVVPSDVTVLNVERRGHQFSDVGYTTQGSIVGAGGVSIAAGNKVGIPYTSCMEVDKFVGFDVTLKTFMTCVNNPYSLLYTENLYAGTSDYGFTYNGAGGSTNIGGYMGVVCNVFALHAIGMKTRFDSGSDAYLAKIGVFDKIYNQSAQGLQIGDVWWEQGHNRVITNLWRSERGLITKIEMSESVHNFPQVVTYTPSAFDTLMASMHAIIYRCNELYKNINYETSPFVAVEDEVISSEYTYNDDICTFAGDYASFREGQIIYLNYNLKEVGSWTSIELTKGNTVVGTYTIDTSAHRYDLTSLNLTHGLYKARMSDGNGNYSDYTYLEVIDTSVTYATESGDNKRITFASTQGEAVYLDVCDLGGRPKAKYQFTDDELDDGYAIVNISTLVASQYNNLVSGATYIKVSFQGDYGRVCSDYLLTDL